MIEVYILWYVVSVLATIMAVYEDFKLSMGGLPLRIKAINRWDFLLLFISLIPFVNLMLLYVALNNIKSKK